MSDENVKVGGLGATLTAVNGISKSSVWILGDDIGAPGRVYPDNPQGVSKLGCVKAGTNITIDTDGTISATGTLGTAWVNVTGKPFDTIGSGLTVTGGVLSVTGGGGSVDWANITNKPLVFPVAIASATQLGGVKQGTNITIAPDGTISATGSLGVDWSNVTNKPTAFPPTPANGSTTLGGVKAGTNITIAPDGTISASGGGSVDWSAITNKPATFTPPIASTTQLGGIKAGKNVTIDADGTLNAQGGTGSSDWSNITNKPFNTVGPGLTVDGTQRLVVSSVDWNTQVTNKPATFAPPIATKSVLGGVKEGAGINIEADGTINTVQAAPEWNEIINKPATFAPPIASSSVLGGVKPSASIEIDPDGTMNVASVDWSLLQDVPKTFNPVIASETVVGGVKQGDNISIDPDGRISATALEIPIASQFNLGGVKIGPGITVQEDGTIGTESAQPEWNDVQNKPREFPPVISAEGVVGGIMPDDNFKISPDGFLSAKPFKGRPTGVVRYDEYGNIGGSTLASYKNGGLVLGGSKPVTENGQQVEATFGGSVTLMDASNTYASKIFNDSFDYDIGLTNGPNVQAGFLPFVSKVVGSSLSLAFGSLANAIGYATKLKIGLAQIGKNIDVDIKGVISVKTADKSNLGLVQPGPHITVDANGVITPELATRDNPGIVQVGPGLEVDVNGVISSTNVIAFVNQFQDVNTDPDKAKQGKWTVPEGVDYFRVTLIGPGGNGGQSGGDAEKYCGGGGGGGGAMAQFIVNAYKFENKEFIYALGASTGPYPTFTGTSIFFSGAEQICSVGGGQNGEEGPSKQASQYGFARGGRPGSVATLVPINDDRFGPRYYASGQAGATGLRITTIADSSVHKSIGGIGGSSGGGSGIDPYSATNGYGAGSNGDGDNFPNSSKKAPGYSYIRIEW